MNSFGDSLMKLLLHRMLRTAALGAMACAIWTGPLPCVVLAAPDGASVAGETGPARLRLPTAAWPQLGCWFWTETEFEPAGYQPFLDLAARHSGFGYLTTSLRVPQREVTDDAVRDQIGRAAAAAREQGIGLVMDLDVRLARAAFRQAYPEELQEMLRLREVDLRVDGEVECRVDAENLGDHYTHRATPYVALEGRLVGVYAYRRGSEAIATGSVGDITARCRIVLATTNQVRVAIPCDASMAGRRACVLVAFAHFTPDVFAPHLLSFQRDILRRYADLALAGACKDEWGFPPCFDGCPAKNDYWFSRSYAAAYAGRTGGRNLERDALLMCYGEQGRDAERQSAINHYQQLAWQRNAAIEEDFYRAVKEVWGPSAIVATHPTWWPHPDLREFKKNGLHWWAAQRDLAQVDEVTPFAVRTALAKKWGSAVWYNMYYASSVGEYERSIWSHALAGGRVNFHPLYPVPEGIRIETAAALLRGPLPQGEARIRLLNLVVSSPLDCPVAVIFGHACAMNWAGPAYNDVGLSLTDALWRQGYPADLIPADEIQAGALRLADNGALEYGRQRYAAAVLFHPEFEPAATADFVTQVARGPTALWRLGGWEKDFDGRPHAPKLPVQVRAVSDPSACAAAIVQHLRSAGVPAQSAATGTLGWDVKTAAPLTSGCSRLLDGTVVVVAGTRDPAGDPIVTNLVVRQHLVAAEARGVLAVRLADDGALEALAAGGLTRFRTAGIDIRLDQPIDLALWRDAQGQLRGVLQGWNGPVPPALARLTPHWAFLGLPPPAPFPDAPKP